MYFAHGVSSDVAVASGGESEAAWEMRVCALADNPPASSRADGGYENGVAAVVADELGAQLAFEWLPANRRMNVDLILHAGGCDVIVGIGESVGGALNSVPFLRVPYVFVTRHDSLLDVRSLDDAVLRDVAIATYPSGLPSVALGNRGIVDNVRQLSPAMTSQGLDRDAPMIDAVVNGDVDVAIM